MPLTYNRKLRFQPIESRPEPSGMPICTVFLEDALSFEYLSERGVAGFESEMKVRRELGRSDRFLFEFGLKCRVLCSISDGLPSGS